MLTDWNQNLIICMNFYQVPPLIWILLQSLELLKKLTEILLKMFLKAYDIYSTGSQLARGGTAIYVNRNFNSFERNDLKINNEEYESVWIEINNKGSKSIICGCLYRHPSNNSKEFLSYLEKCLSQLTKENKEVYICGDFNFDLLNLENNHICQEFYNLLCSYGFLPKIIQPSRITDYHTSLIDNIFSDVTGSLASSAPIFAKLEILKLNDIFIIQIARFIHNCLSFNIICNFHNWFKLNNEIHNYCTRSNYQISLNIEVTNSIFIPTSRSTNYGLKRTGNCT